MLNLFKTWRRLFSVSLFLILTTILYFQVSIKKSPLDRNDENEKIIFIKTNKIYNNDNNNNEINYLLNNTINSTYALTTSSSSTTTTTTLSTTNAQVTRTNIDTCPLIPPNLAGRITVNLDSTTHDDLVKNLASLPIKNGGQSSPTECISRYRVGIVIPYRDRLNNLLIFLRHMHPFLQKQQLDYSIYLVEPLANLTFNRALLMNIGYLEALKQTGDKWDCFVFHDVDLIPEDERNIYSCPEIPRHMSSAVSTMDYRLPYSTIFGGVTALTKEQFRKINGFSNVFFGWGGEDDDLYGRVRASGYEISRYPLEIGRYYMASHSKDPKPNPHRFNLLRNTNKRMLKDGLNSIEYQVVETIADKLYTKILVSYDEKKIVANFI